MTVTKQSSGKKVGVLMSGGVDSSVAAYLLQQEGYAVSGIFITIWNPSHIPCTAATDRQDAMRACATLRIPFVEYDATAIYREKVIEPFVEAYRRGETPNPDVLCNQFVKFGEVFSFVRRKGFERIATGHYAQVREVGGTHRLYQSADTDKDQTYFIYTIAQEALDRTLFPVGTYTKQQVRNIARDADLPAASKKDSTGLCFLGAVSMRDFLSAYIEPKEGEVRLSEGGESVGTHDGAWFYTPGQRHGFTITSSEQGPYTVVSKDIAKNIVFVQKNNSNLKTNGTRRYILKDTIFRRLPTDGEQLIARYRHRGDLYPITFTTENNTTKVAFTDKHTIAPGQSIVLYTADGECLGGGVVV